ncbi:Alpha/Beta hydrolase protein [Phascolomyces articulosus]|uniref:Alpha/Beta hydrolase protein n=1 Tax=Phascolomyces articulosus TaxID=60185 RepID=A0AAD5P7T7_9FUNG|nr:Alpha/Beta hydrolase protein [Phascolomyces articulosus]
MDPNDPATFKHHYATVNGIHMQYIDENQSSKNALLLLHGWPDLWCGWREQIPYLAKLGYRVVVPTLRGFGETDAPAETSAYGDRTVSTDFAALLDYLQIPTVVVIGHDWGGHQAWRFTQFYPERVIGVSSFCVPYSPPAKEYTPIEEIVKLVPILTYQQYLTTPLAEQEINEHTEAFFKRLFRPISEVKQSTIISIYDMDTKSLVVGRPPVPKSDILPQKVLDYYVEKFQKTGAAGSLQYYKRGKFNFEESKDLDPTINKPALMMLTDDLPLPPEMIKTMESCVPNIEIHCVKNTSHWVLWEKPEECNEHLKNWLSKIYQA